MHFTYSPPLDSSPSLHQKANAPTQFLALIFPASRHRHVAKHLATAHIKSCECHQTESTLSSMFPTPLSGDCWQGFTNDPISPLCTNLPENDSDTGLIALPDVPHQSPIAFGCSLFDSTTFDYSDYGSYLSPIPELGQNGWNEYESDAFGSRSQREDSLVFVLDDPLLSHDPARLPLSWRYEVPSFFRDFQSPGEEDCTQTSSTQSYGSPQIPSPPEILPSWTNDLTSILHGSAHSLPPNDRGKTRTPSNGRHKRNRSYQCSIPGCEKRFVHQFDLGRHEKSVHMKQEAGEGYRCASRGCKKADKIWTRLDNFKGHLARKHANEDIQQLVQKSTRSNHDLHFVVDRIPMQSNPTSKRRCHPHTAI